MMKLSVVIVNYNVEHFLEQCLYSVRRAMQGVEGEVFVVDNNSVDGSLKMLEAKFPEVKVIANKDNVGFAKANNQAIRISSSNIHTGDGLIHKHAHHITAVFILVTGCIALETCF